jgi:hypothetical protein
MLERLHARPDKCGGFSKTLQTYRLTPGEGGVSNTGSLLLVAVGRVLAVGLSLPPPQDTKKKRSMISATRVFIVAFNGCAFVVGSQ